MILFFSAVLVGWVLTALVRFVGLKWQVFDVPNSRSAHENPTPTLGGVGLIAGFWVVTCLLVILDMPLSEHIWILLGASVVLCLLIRDEFCEMGRLGKLGVQVLAAFWMVQGGVVLESVTLGHYIFELGNLSFGITVFVLVVLQNLYNFMDGLDGFAALEAVLVSGVLAVLFWTGAPDLATLFLSVCGITLGFWFWNKPPARIFMGDVGAHFLSLCFAMGAIEGESRAVVPFWMAILPLGAFLFDSIYTLMRRLLRRENITRAHRFHLYQRLQGFGWTPWSINGVYALFTVLFSGCSLFLQFGFVSVAYGLLGVTLFLTGVGTVCVERHFLKTEQGTR